MIWSLSKYFPSRFIPTWLLTWLVYRGGTPSAALNDVVPVFPKYEIPDRPLPAYTTQSTLLGGAATLIGGEFRDAIDAVASGATTAATPVDVRIVYRD